MVMLATPNRTPRLPRRLHRLLPYRAVCGDSGQRSPFGGEANDWVVAVEEMNDPRVHEVIRQALARGRPRLDCQTPHRTA